MQYIKLDTTPRESTRHFEVWHDNWAALQLFLSCSTQWRVLATFSQIIYQGLDYTSVHTVMKIQDLDSSIFEQVQLIEQGALEALNATSRT